MFKKFHKQVLIFLAVSSLIILISGSLAIAKKNKNSGTVWEVNSAMTRTEIQGTVDGASDGDTILFLAGTYNWRDAPLAERAEGKGAINIIDKTLTMKGEEGTLIEGRESIDGAGGNPRGVNAFYVKDLEADNDVTFDGLNLHEFLRGISCGRMVNSPEEPDISVENLRNLTIKNCTFSHIHRDAISICHIVGNVLMQNNEMSANRYGLFLSWYWSEGHTAWQPNDTYIRIFDNNVTSVIAGLHVNQTTNVIIKGNTIESEGKGTDWGRGIDIYRTRKGLVISDNTLVNCNRGIYIWGGLSGKVEFEAEGAVIEKNELINIRIGGIALRGDACYGNTVSKNTIHMAPGSWAGILTFAHDNYYGQNKITGSGRYAFRLRASTSTPSLLAHNETLQANNVNKFSADICHFCFDLGTHDNLIVGSGMEYNTYSDSGYNNRITGVTPMTGGIGQDLSEAVKERNEELKEEGVIKH